MTAPHVETLERMISPGQDGWLLDDERQAITAAIALMRGREGWRTISEAASLPRDMNGVSGPCAVLLRIDATRPGPFIRQGRFDVCAGSFVCDSTGHTLRDAVAFIRPDWSAAPTTTGEAQG